MGIWGKVKRLNGLNRLGGQDHRDKPDLEDLYPVGGAYAASALLALEDERSAGRLSYYQRAADGVWMVVLPGDVVPGGDEVSVAVWCVKWFCDLRWEYLDRERRKANGDAS